MVVAVCALTSRFQHCNVCVCQTVGFFANAISLHGLFPNKHDCFSIHISLQSILCAVRNEVWWIRHKHVFCYNIISTMNEPVCMVTPWDKTSSYREEALLQSAIA